MHASRRILFTATLSFAAFTVLTGTIISSATWSLVGVSPNSGPLTGGTVVTISGSGFQKATGVSFGGVNASRVTALNATRLQAVTPAHAAGAVDVVVTYRDSQSAGLPAGFTYNPPPTVSSATPNSGPTAGGMAVTIAGTSFQTGAKVAFGGTLSTAVLVTSGTKLQVLTPTHAAGTVNVVVANPDGQSASLTGGYTYISMPTISSASPNSGPVGGGTTVTISGLSFQSGATVTFGGTSASQVTFVSATQLQALTPTHAAGTANVVVTNPNGQSGSLSGGFTYNLPPKVSSVSPNSGSTAGGTAVNIAGTDFQSGSGVSFGSVAAKSVAFASSSLLLATTPAESAAVVDVTVKNPDGQMSSLPAAFTFSPGTGGPPTTYTSRSDRNRQLESALSPPAVNTVVNDPAFSSRMVRVTDQNTGTPFGSNFTNHSFETTSSAEQNTWNTNSTRFYVEMDTGRTLPFAFDPATMTVTRINISSNPPGWLPLNNGAAFSYSDPDLIYGTAQQNVILKFNFATNTLSTVINTTQCGVTGLQPGTHTGDISVNSTDTRFLAYEGGTIQDTDMFAVVYDTALGCRWYNTQTGQIGGWGVPTGAATTTQTFPMHNARLSRAGDWVRLVNPGGSVEAYWDVATLNVSVCSSASAPYCGGHQVLGYSNLVNQPGTIDAMNIAIRPLTNINSSTGLIVPLPTPTEFVLDGHWSWNNVDPNDSVPVCGSTYRNVTPVLEIGRAWDREVICIRTDGVQSEVWRFAHNRASGTANQNAGPGSNFFATPRGNVSQDGRFYMFSSDWEYSLGSVAGQSGCPTSGQCRTDAFIVELK